MHLLQCKKMNGYLSYCLRFYESDAYGIVKLAMAVSEADSSPIVTYTYYSGIAGVDYLRSVPGVHASNLTSVLTCILTSFT